MSCNKVFSEKGNGLLEMMLFMPIALLLLFLGTDMGILLLDRAMLRDVLRESGNYQFNIDGEELFVFSPEGLVFSEQLIMQYSSRIGERMLNVINERRMKFAFSESPFLVQVRPVLLEINSEEGSVQSFNVLEPLSFSSGDFSIISHIPEYPFISPNSYLEAYFREQSQISKYGFLSPTFNSSEVYLDRSLVFLISVEALSPAISPFFQELILGSRTGVQLHHLSIYRN